MVKAKTENKNIKQRIQPFAKLIAASYPLWLVWFVCSAVYLSHGCNMEYNWIQPYVISVINCKNEKTVLDFNEAFNLYYT